MQKIIVAVHGIGEQVRCATIQTVAYQLCKYCGVPAAIPLGRLNAELVQQAGSRQPREGVLLVTTPPDPSLPEGLGFAEVYWADVPRGPAKDRYTLEGAKKWTQTVVERVRNMDAQRPVADQWSQETYDLAALVLGEMIETTQTLENLLFLAKKAGVLHFDLNQLLIDYLGDVQVFVDFSNLRQQIMGIFQAALARVHEQCPHAEIHLVTHSEGTVIAFLGLLTALRTATRATDGTFTYPAETAWVQQVRSLMTIGSPINKHLLLWPDLWKDVATAPAGVQPAQPIRWRNYYDFGDPVGFRLRATREWMQQTKWDRFFEFNENTDDIGFTRYLFAGKAHNDYWEDEGVFGHFIQTVVQPEGVSWQKTPKTYDRPTTRFWASLVSPSLPYVLAAALIFLGVYVLYRTIEAARPDQMTEESALDIGRNVTAISLLLCGITAAVRIPRVTQQIWWRVTGFLLMIIFAALFPFLASEGLQFRINLIDDYLQYCPGISTLFAAYQGPAEALGKQLDRDPKILQGTLLLLSFAAVAILVVWLVSWLRPHWGVRPLIFIGCGVIFLVLLVRLGQQSEQFARVRYAVDHSHADLAPREKDQKSLEIVSRFAIESVTQPRPNFEEFAKGRIAQLNPRPMPAPGMPDLIRRPAAEPELPPAEKVTAESGPIWPVFLGGAVFFYLWWLAALFLDLVVAWQHFIRRSAILDRLNEIRSPAAEAAKAAKG